MRKTETVNLKRRCAFIAAFFIAAGFAAAGCAEESTDVFSAAPPLRTPTTPGAPDKTKKTDATQNSATKPRARADSKTDAGESVELAPGESVNLSKIEAEKINSPSTLKPSGASLPVTPDNVKDIATVVDLKKTVPATENVTTENSRPESPALPTAVSPPGDTGAGETAEAVRLVRTFKELIELPDDKFDVAEAVLALGSEKGFVLSAEAGETLKRLDKLGARAKSQLPDNPETSDYFDALYDVVLNRKPSEPTHEEKADDFDLSRAVFQHHGNCLSIGIFALSVARRMGAPINGAQCPGHFFLRGTAPAKAKAHETTLNFDVSRPTPDNWSKVDDEFYRKWRHFDSKAEASGEYLRPMTDKQVVSAFLSSRSGYLAREGKFAEALFDSERALTLNPKNIYALINAGYAHESLKNYEEAENQYKQALEFDPQCVRALNNLAFVKIRDKHASAVYDPKKGEKLIDQAIHIDPDQAYLYATKGEICAVRGDYKTATHNLQVALSLAPKNAAYRERFMALREHLRRETPQQEIAPGDAPPTGVPKRK